MKLSTKGRYGLRALADLAVNTSDKPTSVSSIADRQHISDNYLESMFATLKRANIIKSVKGAGGGYVLAKAPSEIGVGEVLRILEGDLSIIESSVKDDDVKQKNLKCFLETNVWNVVSGKINHVVDNLTLQELINRNDFKNLIIDVRRTLI